MRNPDLTFWSLIGFILVLLPASWHLRARNVATLSLIFWLSLANAVMFVNTLIWSGNFRNTSPIWCDISSHVYTAVNYAIVACSLSQMRRLESVASTKRAVITARERTSRLWQEGLLCIVFPVVMLPVIYLVQGHRYNIVESLGPSPVPVFLSWPGILVFYVTPVVIGLAALVYAALAIRWFLIRRLQFRSILASADSNLTVARFFRLIALAITDITVITVEIALQLGLALSTPNSFRKYTSFRDVHTDFGLISQFPAETLTWKPHTGFVVAFYTCPIYSIIFFAFFGLGDEALNDYIRVTRKAIGFVLPSAWGSRPLPGKNHNVLPTLGSKVISVDLASIPTEHELARGPDTGEAIVELQTGRSRIPVQVERFVV
ncbi:hypothetical protein M231_00566 [Tremella mesenterica]|uniref:Pheromone a factor receptor n=1 Tax=Tremella mesenterica TaxID=5217 RepID=A0A4Q1BVR4_TREME|nr:hypothetical protein M231_00566 [Tremella mesenterica]